MKEVSRSFSQVFGFNKLSKYENDYLHDANIRSCSYMGMIVILLEIWMLGRQTYSKIIPKYQAGGELFELFVKYTSKYWLFLLIGLGIMRFCRYQKYRTLSKKQFVKLLIIGSACVLYTGVLSLETFTKVSNSITPVMANIMNAMLISVYVFLLVIGVTIIVYALIKYRKGTIESKITDKGLKVLAVMTYLSPVYVRMIGKLYKKTKRIIGCLLC